MMKQLFFLLSLTLLSCSVSRRGNLEIGMKLPDGVELQSKVNLLVRPGQIETCYSIRVDGVDYLVSIDRDNRLKSISTTARKFVTADRVRVGMKFSDVLAHAKEPLRLVDGWAYVLPLKSGWNAAFEIRDYDSRTMAPDSTVRWLYK